MLHTQLIIVTYNHIHYLPSLFDSLQQIQHDNYRVLVIDNGSSDGTQDYLLTQTNFAEIILNQENTGFCGANNQGMERAFNNGADVCVLLNPDTVVTSYFLKYLEESYLSQRNSGVKIGLLQPVILLKQQPNRINTDGNAIHYLGFGWCKNNRVLKPDYKNDFTITGVSGACLYVSKPYYKAIGAFNESFFAYSEDQDLSWRGLLQNYKHVCSHEAIIYHDYSFSKSNTKWYHVEKNRLILLFQNYSVRTLLLLSLPLISLELAILAYAVLKGFFLEKWKGYQFIWKNWTVIKTNRKHIEVTRLVTDRDLWPQLDKAFNFSEIQHPLLTWLINPLLRLYAGLIYRVL
ncbi:glycosyltransferase family 2 protein [Spirosoma soli]|uniref:Glycosyltransferase family 2 protein n=1 Tax=Spirosoma soli TaxID=1770529 RepID=A0ABW5M8F4_9BACT